MPIDPVYHEFRQVKYKEHMSPWQRRWEIFMLKVTLFFLRLDENSYACTYVAGILADVQSRE